MSLYMGSVNFIMFVNNKHKNTGMYLIRPEYHLGYKNMLPVQLSGIVTINVVQTRR